MRGRHAKTTTTAKRAGKDVPIEAPPGMMWLFDANPAFTGAPGRLGHLVLAPEGSTIEAGVLLSAQPGRHRRASWQMETRVTRLLKFGFPANSEPISSPRQVRKASKRIVKRYHEHVRASAERSRARARIREGLEK